MTVLTAPLFSFSARGKLAKALVFADWRGVQYVRRYVIPGNPQSVAQTLTRDIFATMEAMWKTGGPLMRACFDRYATGQQFVGRNAYLGQNIAAMRGEVDMALYVGSPGAKGGLATDSIIVTPGVAQLSVAFTNPAAPTGWTLQSAVACCFVDQAPEVDPVEPVTEGEDAVTPFDTVVLTGLDTVLYRVAAWLRWVKPDSTLAYGPSIISSGTPT